MSTSTNPLLYMAGDIPGGFLSGPDFDSIDWAAFAVSAVLGIALAALVIFAVVRLVGVLFSASSGDKNKAKEAGLHAAIIVGVIVVALNFETAVNGILGIF